MPRRAIIDRARLDAMLALPDGEAEVIRYYTLIERLVSSAMLQADRHVAQTLTADLPEARLRALDALLGVPPGGAVSNLA